MRYGEMEIEVVPPHVRSHAGNRSCLPMTGKHSNNNPVVPTETAPWSVVKKRQLESDLRLWDGGLASLLDAIGEARRENGLTIQMYAPTSAMGPRMQALQAGLVQLSKWHSGTLAALAAL